MPVGGKNQPCKNGCLNDQQSCLVEQNAFPLLMNSCQFCLYIFTPDIRIENTANNFSLPDKG